MSEKPYTRADVEMVEKAIRDTTPPTRDGYVDGRDLLNAEACAVLDALATGSRLLPARPPMIPGFAWAYTVTFDGDTHWLECDHCSEPVKPVEAGDSLEDIVTRARDHERTCTKAKP